MSKTQVRTKQGILEVTRRINAAGLITGRVDGRTFKAKSWEEVENAIKKAFEEPVEMTSYTVIDASGLDDDYVGHIRGGSIKIDERWVSDWFDGRGRLIERPGWGPARWDESATTIEDAVSLSEDCEIVFKTTSERATTLTTWTDEMQARNAAFGAAIGQEDKAQIIALLDSGGSLDDLLAIGRERLAEQEAAEAARLASYDDDEEESAEDCPTCGEGVFPSEIVECDDCELDACLRCTVDGVCSSCRGVSS